MATKTKSVVRAPASKVGKQIKVKLTPRRSIKLDASKRKPAVQQKETTLKPIVEKPIDPRFTAKPIAMAYTRQVDGSKPLPLTSVLFPPANHGGFTTNTKVIRTTKEDGSVEEKKVTTPVRMRSLVPVTVLVTQGDDRNGYGIVHSVPSYAVFQEGPTKPAPGLKIRFAGGTAHSPSRLAEVIGT